jgi:hypothetical protein
MERRMWMHKIQRVAETVLHELLCAYRKYPEQYSVVKRALSAVRGIRVPARKGRRA